MPLERIRDLMGVHTSVQFFFLFKSLKWSLNLKVSRVLSDSASELRQLKSLLFKIILTIWLQAC